MKKIKQTLYYCICFSMIFSACKSSALLKSMEKSPANTGFISADNAQLYFKVIGKGIPVLVIHGGPGMEHSYFFPHLEELANRYQFIFYDQRASGKSSFDLEKSEMSMDAFVDDIEKIRLHFGLKKLNVMGHSWGGLLAMWYAQKYSDKVDHLVLVSSSPYKFEYFGQAASIQQEKMPQETQDEIRKLILSEEFKNREPEAIEQMFRLNFSASFANDQYLDSLIINIADDYGARQEKLRHLQGDMVNYDLSSSLPNIQAKSLILHGDSDVLPMESVHELRDLIPNSTLVLMEQTGHFPFIESKAAFAEALDNFFKLK